MPQVYTKEEVDKLVADIAMGNMNGLANVTGQIDAHDKLFQSINTQIQKLENLVVSTTATLELNVKKLQEQQVKIDQQSRLVRVMQK